ncbi:MAG TPA: DNA repair protein RecO [Candidatus Moranbacteria bacterium]|nr:DNA repair protein RecO [Candidatus Moranbacteria bacterium]
MDFKYQGIIISKKDIAEVDRIYVIYTLEAGKISIIGKGVRNPNAKLAGNLEPVTYSEIFVARTRGKGKITGAIAINNFLPVKENYSAIRKVFYVFGILEKMITQEEKDEELFGLLLSYLEKMEKAGRENSEEVMDILTVGFILKMADNLGYKINVESCVGCGKNLSPEGNYFSARSGGILCDHCQEESEGKIKVTAGAIKLIRLFLKNKMENLGKIRASGEDINSAKRVANELLKWIIA